MNIREEFEKWSADHDFLGGCDLHVGADGQYADADMQIAWESWKASLEVFISSLSEYTGSHRGGRP